MAESFWGDGLATPPIPSVSSQQCCEVLTHESLSTHCISFPIPDEPHSPYWRGGLCGIFPVKDNRRSFFREVKDRLALSLLARPSRHLKKYDLLYEVVVVFSLPVSSGGTILFAVSRFLELQHVLARYPPYSKRSIPRKGKEFQPNQPGYGFDANGDCILMDEVGITIYQAEPIQMGFTLPIQYPLHLSVAE